MEFIKLHPNRVACLLLVIVASCVRPGATSTDDAGRPNRVSDGHSVAILLTANNADLSLARLAPDHTQNTAVLALARRLITDHTLFNTRISDLSARNGITPVDDSLGLALRDDGARARTMLRTVEGPVFDTAYVANEAQLHRALLALIDDELLPSARNADLRELLIVFRPAVSAHLAHAEQVLAALRARR
ncbi:MAG: DUF4142 domain-containing protein [bacterium]